MKLSKNFRLLGLMTMLLLIGCGDDSTSSANEDSINGEWLLGDNTVAVITDDNFTLTKGSDTLVNSEYEIVTYEGEESDYYLVKKHNVFGDYEATIGYNSGFIFKKLSEDSLQISFIDKNSHWHERIAKDHYEAQIMDVLKSGVKSGKKSTLIFEDDSTGTFEQIQILGSDEIVREDNFKIIDNNEIEVGNDRYKYHKIGISWVVINYNLDEAFAIADQEVFIRKD